MMSFTGSYFSSPFNLGNRIVFYFSFFLTIMFIQYFNKNFLLIILFTFILLPFAGLSNHWKEWNYEQQKTIKKIVNMNFENIKDGDVIFLNGKNFSKLGFVNHIEFLSMPWLLNTVFKKNPTINCLNNYNSCKIFNINNHSIISENFYYDEKYKENINVDLKDKNIFYFNVKKETLIPATLADIKKIISEREPDIRHWVLSNYFVNFLEKYQKIIPSRLKIYLN